MAAVAERAGHKKHAKRKQDDTEDADSNKPSKRKTMIVQESDDQSEDVDTEDEREKENEKLFSLFSNLGEKPIANIPINRSCECKVKVEGLNKEVRLLKEKVHDLERMISSIAQKAEGLGTSDRPMVVPSTPTTPGSKSADVESNHGATSLINIEHNGFNLLTVKAPPKEPKKNALRLLDKLFTTEELSQGILFASKRSGKKELDQERVQKMFEVLHANYGREKVQRMHQLIVDACNQKCRDCARKITSKEKTIIENDNE